MQIFFRIVYFYTESFLWQFSATYTYIFITYVLIKVEIWCYHYSNDVNQVNGSLL